MTRPLISWVSILKAMCLKLVFLMVFKVFFLVRNHHIVSVFETQILIDK